MAVVLEWGEIFPPAGMLDYTNLLRIINDPLSKTPAILAGAEPFPAIQFSQKVIKTVDQYCL